MKKILTAALLFFATYSNAQLPAWTWAKLIGGKSFEYISSIAYGGGSIYVSGFFNSDTLQIDSLTVLNDSAGTDLFVARFDTAGNAIWINRAGGANEAGVYDIAADPQGNCYITGYFNSSTIIFGNDTFVNPQLPGGNCYIVKYDSSGNVLWSKVTSGGHGQDIAADAAENCYVAGAIVFAPYMVFDSDTVYNSGTVNTFIVSYDKFGNLRWTAGAGGEKNDAANDITTDGKGNCYVTGYFISDTMYFDTLSLVSSTPGCTSYCLEAYIAKYDSAGQITWVQNIGSLGSENGHAVAADSTGCYAAGYFQSDTLVIGSSQVLNAGGTCFQSTCTDAYLVRFDPSGAVQWARSIGGNEGDGPGGLALDPYGNCIFAGSFSSHQVTIGGVTLYNFYQGGDDVMLSGFDRNGNALWSQLAGYSGKETCTSVTADNEGNIYISGQFTGDTTFFSNMMLLSHDTAVYDIFIAKLSPYFITGTAKQLTNNLKVYPNPANESFRISGLSNASLITILNAEGKEIYSDRVNNEEFTFRSVMFSPGLYLIHINDGYSLRTLKLIKSN